MAPKTNKDTTERGGEKKKEEEDVRYMMTISEMYERRYSSICLTTVYHSVCHTNTYLCSSTRKCDSFFFFELNTRVDKLTVCESCVLR